MKSLFLVLFLFSLTANAGNYRAIPDNYADEIGTVTASEDIFRKMKVSEKDGGKPGCVYKSGKHITCDRCESSDGTATYTCEMWFDVDDEGAVGLME